LLPAWQFFDLPNVICEARIPSREYRAVAAAAAPELFLAENQSLHVNELLNLTVCGVVRNFDIPDRGGTDRNRYSSQSLLGCVFVSPRLIPVGNNG